MRRSRHILAASLLASSVGAPIAAHAQQSPQSDSGRVADSAARHSTPVISGLATTIPAKNAPDAVSVVPVSDSTRPPAAALETLLDGRVPGATIETSTSDPPGTGMQVRVRGVTSIDNTDAPLYVVDGVQVISSMTSVGSDGGVVTSEGDGINRIVDINPSDIESIQVLRGPSATAILRGRRRRRGRNHHDEAWDARENALGRERCRRALLARQRHPDAAVPHTRQCPSLVHQRRNTRLHGSQHLGR